MFSSRMTLPAWDSFPYEPLDNTTVVSDDIWKKFDLDDPSHSYQYDPLDDPLSTLNAPLSTHYCEMPMMMNFDKLNCQATSEIRHHDCMWAGLCISKEHNRTLPAKKDPKIQRRIPAGRSLLIPKNLQQQQAQQQQQTSLLHHNSSQASGHACRPSASSMTLTKNLESDGDSTRPETPQSSGESATESEEEEEEEDEEEEEEEEEEDEVPMFKHDQINIHEIVPASMVTGQRLQRTNYDRRKEEENIRNTLMSDHCYHLSQQQPPAKAKHLECLGVQTPSDSEEEIDVVSWDKPTRAANTVTGASPTHPNPAEHNRSQTTVPTVSKERKSSSGSSKKSKNVAQQSVQAAEEAPPAPRGRGRPPSNATVASRKRAAAAANLEQAPPASTAAASKKRTKATGTRTYTRRKPAANKKPPAQTSPRKNGATTRTSSSEDEIDLEKRSLHNNMERQRRVDLRDAFDNLRLLVPELEDKDKAAKVTILRHSAAHCNRLTRLFVTREAKLEKLQLKQDKLLLRLGELRRELHATRVAMGLAPAILPGIPTGIAT